MYESQLSASKVGRLVAFSAGFALFLGLVATPLIVAAGALKPVDLPSTPAVPINTTIYDVHGTPIAVLHGDENRSAISGKRMPLSIRQAVVAPEDRLFFEHGAVSIGVIARALTTRMGTGHELQARGSK